LLGALRGVAQRISYEVALALMVLCVLVAVISYDLGFIGEAQKGV